MPTLSMKEYDVSKIQVVKPSMLCRSPLGPCHPWKGIEIWTADASHLKIP